MSRPTHVHHATEKCYALVCPAYGFDDLAAYQGGLTGDQTPSLADVLAEHRQQFRPQTGDSTCLCGQWQGPFTVTSDSRSFAAHLAEQIAPLIAAAEQRGREDNADHGMCYVHGSAALEAREQAASVRARLAEADWLDEAHANSHDKGYSAEYRLGFAAAAGWVRFHALNPHLWADRIEQNGEQA